MKLLLDPAYCQCVGPSGPGTGLCEDDLCFVTHLLLNGEPLRQLFVDVKPTGFIIEGFPGPDGPEDFEFCNLSDDPAYDLLRATGSMGFWNFKMWYQIRAHEDGTRDIEADIVWKDEDYFETVGSFTVRLVNCHQEISNFLADAGC